VAAFAAFLGDIGLYWLGQRGMGSKNGSRWLERLRERAAPDRLQTAQQRLDDHGVAVLVLSRLVPAGRIPVMLACLLGRMPMRRFLRGDAPACLAWAGAYGLIGILGGSLFAEPWQGVVAVVVLTLVISAAPAVWRRLIEFGP
jgi:membrane protein DedA with SNARE-associated domain